MAGEEDGAGKARGFPANGWVPSKRSFLTVVESAVVSEGKESEEYEAAPPILREDICSDMKILTTHENYPQLNGFGTFLGLSDRLM